MTAPVPPEHRLEEGDLLSFVGRVDRVIDLQRMAGLSWAEAKHINALGSSGHAFHEAVVGPDLAGEASTLRSIGFRARFNAAVLAIYRADQRMEEKLGDVTLHLGDTLLVLADPEFGVRWRHGRDFLLIAPISSAIPQRPRKRGVVLAIGALFIALTGTGLLPILHASLAVVVALLLAGVLNVVKRGRPST